MKGRKEAVTGWRSRGKWILMKDLPSSFREEPDFCHLYVHDASGFTGRNEFIILLNSKYVYMDRSPQRVSSIRIKSPSLQARFLNFFFFNLKTFVSDIDLWVFWSIHSMRAQHWHRKCDNSITNLAISSIPPFEFYIIIWHHTVIPVWY